VKSGRLSVLVYHGNKERKITKREMAQYDVIITTYGIILSEVKTAMQGCGSGSVCFWASRIRMHFSGSGPYIIKQK
jgi:hypothetical protein